MVGQGAAAAPPGQPGLPSVSDVLTALTTLIKAQFFSALSEYGVGPMQSPPPGLPSPSVQWAQITDPGQPPANYADADVRGVVTRALQSGELTTPQACTVYCVVTGADTPPPRDVDMTDAGYHQSFTHAGQPAVYAYIRGQQIPNHPVFDGSLALITTVLAHEIAEAVTDPFLDAVRDPALPLGEIGDICGAFNATVGGVDVAPYWSQTQNLCVTGGPQIRQQHSGFAMQSTWQNAFGLPAPFELFVAPQTGPGVVRWRKFNPPQPCWDTQCWQSETVLGPPAWLPKGGTFAPPAVLQSRHGLIGFAAGALFPNQKYEFTLLFRLREDLWQSDAEGSVGHGDIGDYFVGRPAIIQSDGGRYGNYEAVLVLTDGSITHYTRDNDGQYTWSDPHPIPITAVKNDARVALLQASFQSSFDAAGTEVVSGGAPGSLHVVVQTGGRLYHALFTGQEWAAEQGVLRIPHQKPRRVISPISAGGQPISGCVGTPGLIETKQGRNRRNFQLVIAKSDGSIEHYARENDTSPFTWRLVSTFAAGDSAADVSLFQSTLPGSPLDVIAITQGGAAILHYQQSVHVSAVGLTETWRKETVVSDPERLWKL